MVTSQPASQTVYVGQSATFTVAATGSPTPTVQWQLSLNAGSSWVSISGATSTSYNTGATATWASGIEYRAVFTSSSGTATTTAAVLTILAGTAPVITTQPTPQSAPAGQTVTFTAAASGTPAPTLMWQFSIDSGASWHNLGVTTNSFTTGALTTNTSGWQLRAQFTNPLGVVSSNPALLTVLAAGTPLVTTQPVTQTVIAPQSATFTVAASGTPTPTVQWQFSGNLGTSWTNIVGATSTSYNSGPTATWASGIEYRAVFTNSAGTVASNGASLHISPAGAPVITTQPTAYSVTAGGTGTFTAAASGTPSPTVQWQLSTDSGTTWSNIANATSTTYITEGTMATDTGSEYRAVFTNTNGTATTNAAVLTVINASIPGITLQPVSLSVIPGQTATFSAASLGPPTPTVQWQLSTDSGTTWSNIVGATSGSYATGPNPLADSGWEYRAVFTNIGGVTDTNPATLTVANPVGPAVTAQPSNQPITSGQTVTVTAAASGSPTPGAQWQSSSDGGTTWTSITGATSPSYTSGVLAVASSGLELRAVFTNASGTATSNPATITVVAAPTMPASGLYSSPQYTTSQITTYSGVEYTTAPDANGVIQPVLLDIFEPPDAQTSPQPTIVDVHGGAFVGGSRTDEDGDAMQWALRGYVGVSIDYRLANLANAGNQNEVALAGAAIPDAQQSIRWLKANAATYGVDTTRIAINGSSAGGALSLGVGLASNVPYTGPLSQFPPTVAAAISTGAFLTPGLSLLTLTSSEPHVMMFQYDYDISTRVTSAYAFQTCDALRDLGNTCDEVDLAGSGHTTDLVPGGQWWASEVGPFIWRALNLGS